MMGRGRASWLGACLLSATVLGPMGAARAQTVWFGGNPLVKERIREFGPGDYPQMFLPGAPWDRAAHVVKVFIVSTQYLAHQPEDTVRRMIQDLDRRGVYLAVEALMISGDGRCGRGVEGYSSPGEIAAMAARVRKLGGVLRYAAMDEPLWFGHFYQGPNACRAPIAEVAQSVASNVRALKAVFPDVIIGDVEPFSDSPSEGVGPADVMAFARAYRDAAGTPLAFVHADLHWDRKSEAELEPLKAELHAAGIRFGVIYDGNPDDQTDLAWTRAAEARFQRVEQREGGAPDDAILETWMTHPSRMLPESEPGTMTNLVLLYARPVTRLKLERAGLSLVGTLTEGHGAPVTGAAIALRTEDGRMSQPPSMRVLQGTVPQGAARATVALRVNTETDGRGGGQAVVGMAHYREAGAADVERDPLGVASDRRLLVAESQSVSRNSPSFLVSAGRPFTLTVPVAASAGLDEAGYVAVIFLDSNGRGLRRLKIPFAPEERSLGEVRTDARGQFRFAPAPSPVQNLTIDATFRGDARRRGATATVN